jgi:hypothetical protein
MYGHSHLASCTNTSKTYQLPNMATTCTGTHTSSIFHVIMQQYAPTQTRNHVLSSNGTYPKLPLYGHLTQNENHTILICSSCNISTSDIYINTFMYVHIYIHTHNSFDIDTIELAVSLRFMWSEKFVAQVSKCFGDLCFGG